MWGQDLLADALTNISPMSASGRKADVQTVRKNAKLRSANGRSCVKRALILMSMGQRTTLAMNRQRRRLLVPL